MGYLLTPEERRARARAFIANKNARQEYQRALSLERANKNFEAARKAEIESKSFIVRAGASTGDVIGNIITGAVKGVEGIVDIGIGAVGAVGGIFDDDFQDKMKAAVSYDFAGNVVGQPLQDAFKYSYWEENGLVDQFAQGVGQMLPAVVATIATYGAYGGFAAAGSAASAASAANTASLITMGASAAGNATEEAFNEGANYYAGLGYGVASGAVEVATEKLTGGIMKNVTGAGIFDGVRVSIADTGAKRFIKGAIEEGAEEMVAEAFSPALKSIYKGREAFDAYKDAETYKNIGKAGLMGAAVSSFYGGTVNVALAKAGIGAVGKEADISESLIEIEAIKKRMNQYQSNDKLNAETRAKFDALRKGNYDNIEKALKSSSAEKRKKMIDKFNLGAAFDESGSIRPEFLRQINREVDESTLPEELRQESQTIRKVADEGVYSANLVGNEARIAEDLAMMRFQLLDTAMKNADAKNIDFDAETYANQLVGVTVADGTFTDAERSARSDFNKAINRFNNLSNGDLSFVIIEGNGLVNGGLKNGVMYISKSQLSDGQWVETVVHELTHAEEGTEEYNKMREFLLGEDITVEVDGKPVSLRERAINAVKQKGYGFTEEMLAKLDQKNKDGLKLTEEEQAIEDAFNNEITAHATGYLLGNKEFITQFVADEAGLAEQFVARLQKIKKALSSLKSAEARKQLALLKKAEKLYYNAAVESGNTRLAKMISGKEEEDEGVEKNEIANKHLKNRDFTFNLRATKSHKAKLAEQYSQAASVDLDVLTQRYEKIIDIWERLGGELNSKFLTEWNDKVGKDRAFTVFKAQAGYKYNVELSSMCKKGVPLFEAIDTIVKEEVMNELNTKVLGKEEKEVLYDLLKEHNFEIPCAICYVEQARQREGVIIDSFLNGKVEKNNSGKVTTFKLGWNKVLNAIEMEMRANGVDYTFSSVDRNIATDKYVPTDISMDASTQDAFYEALKKIANKEITRYNKAEGKNRKLITNVTPTAIKECFKGTLPSNLKIFKVLFTEPSSRFKIESDLLYSSMTTHNLANAHNALYSLFNSQGGVSGYKTKQGAVVYWGDILGKTWSPSKVRDEGGIRNQSNSDFQMYTLLDQAQMYIDFTAKGYYLQAYTKVLSELKLFGLSRGKINASLIPAVYIYRNADGSIDIETTRANAGLDANGELLFDDIEGINHKEAFMLLEDAEYSKSIGGICIGYSDDHILKLLDDSRVQQIIGYHDKTDDPDKRYRGAKYAKNYNGLNEAINNKDGKTIHIGFNPYVRKAEKMFTFNSKTETYEGKADYNGKTYVADDIPKLAADLYLDMCKTKDYTPAYRDFADRENYYKLLADFSLYDSQGHYAPHRKVAYNMPDSVPYLDINGKKKYMPTKDYIKAELEKELKVRDSISEALADKSETGLIPQFVKRVNELKPYKNDSVNNPPKNNFDFSLPEIVTDENGNIKLKYDPFADKSNVEAEVKKQKTNIAKKRKAPLSTGRQKARLADATRTRVYSKAESEAVINDIISTVLGGDKTIAGKTKAEAVEILWQSLNSANDKSAVATDLANYLINSAVLENSLLSNEKSEAIEIVDKLKQYLHRMNLDFIKDDIKHKFDKNNIAYARWQKRKGKTGVSPDVVAMDLAELGIIIEADNPADIFLEIDKLYSDARDNIKKDVKEALTDVFADDPKGLDDVRNEIRQKILDIYKSGGKATAYQKLLDANNFGFWEQTNHLLASIRKIREQKLGIFFNSSNYRNKAISSAVNKLANIERLGQLRRDSARDICRGIDEWYTQDNPLFASSSAAPGLDTSIYRPEIKEALGAVINGQGALNVADMRNLLMVTDHLAHVVDSYKKAIYRGKLVDAKDLAERFIPNIVNEPKESRVSKIIKGYIETFQSPEVVVRYFDGYKDGFFTEMFNELRNAATAAEVMNMTLHQPLEEFIASHKKFYENAKNHEIAYIGTHTLDALKAMSLYMSLKRQQAVDGLARFGFTYEDKDGRTQRAPGFIDPDSKYVPDELVQARIDDLYRQFTDAEKEYIGIVEGLLNNVCKAIKRETDIKMKGFTNVIEGYYFPIARANIAKTVDATFFDEMRATDASFNKNTVKKAKNELYINDIGAIVDRHLSGIAMYANLAPTIECYNIVSQFDVDDTANKPTTILTEIKNRWPTAETYFRKLVADIQHIPSIKSDGTMVNANKLVGSFISAYAKSVLGANPKVMLTQMSSLFAASSVIDAKSIIKGMTMNGKDVTEWSDLAALRAHNNDAVMAMGLFDKLGKVSDTLMRGIEFMDGFVVQKLFAACQVEVEKKQGHKIGTNDNKIAAAKLLEEVIYKTQQSSLATEKSAAMRSGNAIYRIFTMFRSDAMKVQGQVITAVGEYKLAKKTYEAEPTEGNIRSLKAARKRLTKAVSALVTAALFNALVALGFKWLYNTVKDDEEDKLLTETLYDFFGNMIGGLPIISDVIDFLVSGYGFEDMQLSVVTDLLNSAKKIFSLFDRNTTGEEITASVRDLIFTASAMFGIPTKNVYKFAKGITSRIFPNVGYRIDSFFGDQPYSKDLKKAIEDGDDKRIDMITALMLDESFSTFKSATVREPLRDLISKGYDIIPRTFNGKLTIDGESVELSRREQIAFEEIYEIANESLETLIKYNTFKNASDSVKANAIKRIYDIYWNLAISDYTGEAIEDKTVLMAEAIPVEKLALIRAFVAEISADTDKDGKVISGSRKRKVQQFVASLKLTVAEKYIVMGYLGYKNTNGEDMVKRHISKLRLSAEEKKLLLKYSGYESA